MKKQASEKEIKEENREEIENEIKEKLQKKTIITIDGELGVGKTTLIKKLLQEKNIKVQSPSFQHALDYGEFIHIDAYTLKTREEFFSLGIEELIEEKCIIIEWGEKFEEELKIYEARRIKIKLRRENEKRFIIIEEMV